MISRDVAVIYCRVASGTEPEVKDNLNAQEAQCRSLAQAKGYQVIEVFHDHTSGNTADRPGLNALRACLHHRHPANTVVILNDAARLARGAKAFSELRSTVTSAGGILETAAH